MRWTVVAIASGVVLGAAVLASRALLSEPSLPPAPPTPPPPTAVVDARPTPPPIAPSPPPAPVAQPAPGSPLPPPAPVAVAPTPSAPLPAGAPPPTEPQPDDVDGAWSKNSRELAYAEALLAEEPPVRDRVISAHGVFERCLGEQPDNERCIDGLRRANALIRPTIPKGLKQNLKPFQPVQNELIKSRNVLKQP